MFEEFDVLIIGSGIAGLSAAVELAQDRKLRIAIVTREQRPEVSNTYWAQGGIIYPSRDFGGHQNLAEDIQEASSHTSNPEAAKILLEYSPQVVKEVLLGKAKTEFQKTEEGKLALTREAAHTVDRIIYQGDYTGKAIQLSLLNFVADKKENPNIHFFTAHTAIDLITPSHHGRKLQQRYEKDKVVGAYLLNQKTQEVLRVMAKKTILASGGVGALYLHHSNAEGARGDGHAMAVRAGAKVINMEFIQFHPTTFYDRSSHRRFLISEALRGEGGKLINSQGMAFMERYHPDCELAPRDVVARAIKEEMIKTREDCIYLDMTAHKRDWLKERFPTIFQYCLEKRIDMATEPIPVVPAAHYTCGGVKTDLSGRTNLENLYAVGEVACNGLHGANRLASTSLLEGLTWGHICAKDIEKSIQSEVRYPVDTIRDWQNGKESADLALLSQDWLTLKQTMWNYVGLIRSRNRLRRGAAMLTELQEEIQMFYKHSLLHDELIGLRNGVETARMVLNASLRNTHSIGCFYRRD